MEAECSLLLISVRALDGEYFLRNKVLPTYGRRPLVPEALCYRVNYLCVRLCHEYELVVTHDLAVS